MAESGDPARITTEKVKQPGNGLLFKSVYANYFVSTKPDAFICRNRNKLLCINAELFQPARRKGE